MSKRGASPPSVEGALVKRAKADGAPSNKIAISSSYGARTSGLEAPIVSLAGAHSAEILSCRFDPTGQNIAACSADRSVSLWRTYPPNTNYALLSSLAKAPILDLQWSLSAPLLYTVSADHVLSTVDLTTGQRLRKTRAHHAIINALDRTLAPATELLATASDDGTVKIWDAPTDASTRPVATLDAKCPVTAVCWSADATHVYAAALDNEIHVYDLRTHARLYSLKGHSDTPTSLALSPDGSFLLSPALSSHTLIHDVRPFSPSPARLHRVLHGAPAGFENTLLRAAWSRDDAGKRVAVGGADRTVTIWDVDSASILYKLPGHKGTVTAVDFHPTEPIILTASKDGTMLLGEIDPRLSV